MLSVGRALIFTSLVFFAGFGLFLFSSFHAIRGFGGQVSFTVVGALLADLLLLPGLILVLRPFKKKIVVGQSVQLAPAGSAQAE